MQDVLRDSDATLSATFYDDDQAVDVGDVDVTVTSASGEQVASGAATADPNQVGVYTFDLPAQPDVDLLTATWAATSQTVRTQARVVGGHYARLGEIRNQRSLDNEARYPLDLLRRMRLSAEATFQGGTGVAWQPRYGQHTAWGVTSTVFLPHLHVRKVLWARADGAALDLSNLTVTAVGRVSGLPSTPHMLEIGYEHGYDVIPGDLQDRFMDYVRYLAVDDKSDLPDRATSMVTEGVSFRISTPSEDRPTGLPAIDATLSRYDERIVGFA